jgi:hypothetical protein
MSGRKVLVKVETNKGQGRGEVARLFFVSTERAV